MIDFPQMIGFDPSTRGLGQVRDGKVRNGSEFFLSKPRVDCIGDSTVVKPPVEAPYVS